MTAHLCVADSFSFVTNLLNNATTNQPDLMLAPGLGVHRSLLASLSPLLSSILQTTVSDMPLLVLPHVESSTVERMVQLVYCGSCSVSYSEMPNLVQLLEDLDLTVVLQSLSLGTKVKQVEKRTFRTNNMVDININGEDGVSVGVVLEDLTHECEVCRKKFRAGEELGLHFVKQHCFKQDSSMLESGKVQCIKCYKMFNDRDVIKLLEHIGHDHGELLENGSLENANNCEVVEVNENISHFKECDNVIRNISEVGVLLTSGGDDVEFEESANNEETSVALEESGANEETTPPNTGFELTGNTVINNNHSFAAKEAGGANSCDIINDDNNIIAGYHNELVENVRQLLSDDEESGRAMNENTNSNNTSSNVDVGVAAVSGKSVVATEESAVADEKSTCIIGFQISVIDFESSNVTGNAANNKDSFVAVNDISIEESTIVSENSTHAILDISVKDVGADISVAVDDNNNAGDQLNLKETVSSLLNNHEASEDESDLANKYYTDSNDTECDVDMDEDEIFPFIGQRFYCEICQKITPTRKEFVAHIRTLHQDLFDEAESRSKSELETILYYLKQMKKLASLKPKSDGKMSLESNQPNSRIRMKLRPKMLKKFIEDVGKTQVTPWKYIKVGENLYTGTADVKKADFLESFEPEQCDCAKEDDDTPACGSRCINWSTSTECDPQVCVNGVRCMNMVIQKKQYVPGLQRFMTKDKGWGVMARQRVLKGTFIMEYTGQVCSSKEYERRLVSQYKEDDHRYCLALNSKTVIDAHRAGSECRFVNHSCDPNCRMDKWTVAGLPRMALFSLRDISPAEEICFDYMFSLFNTVMGVACKCGAKECRRAQVIDIDSEDEEPAQLPAAGDIIVIDSDEEDTPQTQVTTLDVSALEVPVRLTRARKKIGDVIVNVMNDVPAITNLEKLNNGDCERLSVSDDEGCEEVLYQKFSLYGSTSKYLARSRVTEGVKSFFSMWNKFLVVKGYDSGIGRIHMEKVLEQFIQEQGRLVMEAKLYKKFVRHLLNLSSDNLLSLGGVVRLQGKIVLLAGGRQLGLE